MDLYFDNMDFHFISTAAATSQISVKINGLGAICQNNCEYAFVETVP